MKNNSKSIKNRIMISNTVMLFFSMAIILLASWIMIEIFETKYESLFSSINIQNKNAKDIKNILNNTNPAILKEIFRTFKISFIVVGIIFIAGNILIGRIVTKKLLKVIMKPLNLLDSATERIGRGNFSQPVNYNEEDEFRKVCRNFDNMQILMKEEKEKNRAYEKARINMIAGISHDLRTPLTSVKGYIKGVLDGVADTQEKRTRYLETAYKKSCSIDALITKLSEYSKMETGKMNTFIQKTDMKKLLTQYINNKAEELADSKIKLFYDNRLSPENDFLCMLDKEQFVRIAENLIENSIKYADAKPLKIVFSVELESVENSYYLKIDIFDNGKGVEEDKLPHIFDLFYRGDESRNSSNEGNGIGLYVCKYMVESWHGKISAYNQNGFHTKILLPVCGRN